MTLAFGYVRASTIEEVKQGSNERQREIIENFFKAKGWEYKIFEDRAKSGANMERPEFQKMIATINSSPPEELPLAVVVSKIDRYARSLIDLLNSIKTLEEKNIGFISIQDSGIDTTTPNGRLFLQILGAFAEFERTVINSRTKAGRDKALAMGVKFGRPALKISGGKFIDQKKVIELHDRGLSCRAIAKSLDCSITPILKIVKNQK